MKKLWPIVLAFTGMFVLIPAGFALLLSGDGYAIVGLTMFALGCVAFFVGCGTLIFRFAMRRHLVPHLLFGLTTVALILFACHRYCFSVNYVRGAKEEDCNILWYAALKPLFGDVYYVGSDGGFSYFRQGAFFPERHKVRTAELKLPRLFQLGKNEPYVVTIDMVPEN